MALGSCGSQAWLLHSIWNLPGPGIEPMCLALAGGFLLTYSTRKSLNDFCSSHAGTDFPHPFQRLCHPLPSIPWGYAKFPSFLDLSQASLLASQMVRTRAFESCPPSLSQPMPIFICGCSESSFKFQRVSSTFSWPLGISEMIWSLSLRASVLLTLCLPVLFQS